MDAFEALRQVREALFPEPVKDGNGYYTDSSAFWNLEGARVDLERLKADRVCINTIKRVQQQLVEAERAIVAALGPRE